MLRAFCFLAAGLALAAAVLLLVYLADQYDWAAAAGRLINDNTPLAPFLILMAVLPILGFPISVFLVVSGIKFGLLGGILVSTLFYPLHLVLSYYLANSVVRQRLSKMLARWGYDTPRIPGQQLILYGSIFAAIPVIPYTPKNYLLALAGLPFKPYVLICWPIHTALGLPFIFLGQSAVSLDFRVALAAVVLLTGAYVIAVWLRRRYAFSAEEDSEVRKTEAKTR
ncbi:MAG: hypothetical protein HY788_09695 [Deltaproteobacteria bacterium]|nr:hypothetical protein [Deltaproteobacteria bacterium]